MFVAIPKTSTNLSEEAGFHVRRSQQPTELMKLPLLMSLCLISFAARSPFPARRRGLPRNSGRASTMLTEKMKDAVDPKGPVEKAGEKVDKALGK